MARSVTREVPSSEQGLDWHRLLKVQCHFQNASGSTTNKSAIAEVSLVLGQSTRSHCSSLGNRLSRASQCAKRTSRRMGWLAGRKPAKRQSLVGRMCGSKFITHAPPMIPKDAEVFAGGRCLGGQVSGEPIRPRPAIAPANQVRRQVHFRGGRLIARRGFAWAKCCACNRAPERVHAKERSPIRIDAPTARWLLTSRQSRACRLQ